MNKKTFISYLATLSMLFFTQSLFGQGPATLSLSEALAHGMEHSSWEMVTEGNAMLSESRVRETQTWDNPNFSASTETVDQAGISTSEQYFLVSQRIELFGTRNLRVDAERQSGRAQQLNQKAKIRDYQASIKTRFFNTLYLQKRVEILEDWQANANRIFEIIAAREQAGEISGFDRQRLQRELAEARLVIDRERAHLNGSWRELANLLGLNQDYTLIGDLLPPAIDEKQTRSINQEVRSFDAQISAAAAREEAASRWLLPEITLQAGIRRVSVAGEEDFGLFVSAAVPLPVFNRGKARRAKARAEGQVARGEQQILRSQLQAKSAGLVQKIRQMRAAAIRFQADGIDSSLKLIGTAELAYANGELAFHGLLDAFRSLRDAQLKHALQEAETRDLSIEYERIGGLK